MSRCHCKTREAYAPVVIPQPTTTGCICSLPTLVILILIVLQFSKHGKGYSHDDDYADGGYCDKDYPVGNGILFIIALFFLSCVGCGKPAYGAY